MVANFTFIYQSSSEYWIQFSILIPNDMIFSKRQKRWESREELIPPFGSDVDLFCQPCSIIASCCKPCLWGLEYTDCISCRGILLGMILNYVLRGSSSSEGYGVLLQCHYSLIYSDQVLSMGQYIFLKMICIGLEFIVSWLTIVEGDPKAPFSIVTTLTCREGHYSFFWIVPLALDLYFIMLSVSGIKYHLVWLDLGLNPGFLNH